MGGVSVALAIGVGLVSSFIQSLGLTIQRKSHVEEECRPVSLQRKPIKRPLWLIGFSIYITSNIFSTIFQLDALPIVILAPLGAVSLIYNALLARMILGDHFGSRAILGTGLVACGAVLIAVFGVVPEGEHELDELLRLFDRGAFVAFFSVMTVGTALVLLSAHIAVWSIQRHLRPPKGISLSNDGIDTPPLSAPVSNYASPHDPPAIPFRSSLHPRRWSAPLSPRPTYPHAELLNDTKTVRFNPTPTTFSPKIHPGGLPSPTGSGSPLSGPGCSFFPAPPPPSLAQQKTLTLAGLAFAAASGVLSGMSLVLAKAAVELLVITLEWLRTGKGENQFTRVESWLLVGGLVLGALLQLVYLNYSLTFASPALICPLAFCFFNMSSIFDGLVFYDQFGRLAHYQIALVSVGVATLLFGVWVVSAIQPTGDGGVDVGTWVEEEEDEEACGAYADETSSLLGGGQRTDEPEDMDQEREDNDQRLSHSADGNRGRDPVPAGAESTLVDLGTGTGTSPQVYPQPQPRTQRPRPLVLTHARTPSTGDNPFMPDSPSPSPLSPTLHRRRRTLRYGTLLPDLTSPLAATPAGFSIGLGAASPGFVLRPAAHVHGQGQPHAPGIGRKGRSRSEGTSGIESVLQGGVWDTGAGVGLGIAGVDAGAPDSPQATDPRRRSGGEETHVHARRESWLGRWWAARRGRIRLEGEEGREETLPR